LHRALCEHAKQFSRRNGIPVHINGTDINRQRAAATESSLFRIAQEALANCAKHSRATAIKIELAESHDRTILSISDNGIGFAAGTTNESAHGGGLGLLAMRERAEAAGGKFTLESAPGKGTRVRVEM
jgi:signal transduction histidine kinase